MPTRTFNTYDGSFTIEDAGPPKQTPLLEDVGVWRNGLVQAIAPTIASVVCGITDHPAEVTIERLDRPPGDPDPEWEAVAEVSLVSMTGRLHVRDWGGTPVEGLLVEGLEDGPIRVRVSARDRDSQEREC